MENLGLLLLRAFLRVVFYAIMRWLWSILSLTKSQLAQMYGVGVKTFNKWVRYFCPRIHSRDWKSLRILRPYHLQIVFQALGRPAAEEVKSKAEMVIDFETDLKTLKENVLKLFRKIGILPEAYEKLNIFPPAIVQRIAVAIN